ncbi:MAG: hypothetical protein WC243_02615 [Patescibacteria group bacterium]|jgi:predicted nucleotidyltransferase
MGLGDKETHSKLIIDSYKRLVEKECDLTKFDEVRILGSYGRGEPTSTSDLDVWFILTSQNNKPLDVSAVLSNKDLKIRRQLIKQYKLRSTFIDNRATILTGEEAKLYNKAFPVRLGIPYDRGEQRTIIGNPNTTTYSCEEVKTDLAVSINEFIENWETAIINKAGLKKEKKWLYILCRDLLFFRDGIQVSLHKDLDKIFANYYRGNFNLLVKEGRDFYRELVQNIPAKNMSLRKLSHSLMWTYEKVEWELIESFGDIDYFNNWRFGKYRLYGFFPFELEMLIEKVTNILGSGNLKDTDVFVEELVELRQLNYDLKNLPHTYKIFQNWVLSALRLSLENEKNSYAK